MSWQPCCSYAFMPSSPSLQTMKSLAARASSCWITLSIFLCMLSLVATTMMGRCSSTSASGPCFISPARMPSLWMRATSLAFRAASSAVA